jgi:hypothetical protein
MLNLAVHILTTVLYSVKGKEKDKTKRRKTNTPSFFLNDASI